MYSPITIYIYILHERRVAYNLSNTSSPLNFNLVSEQYIFHLKPAPPLLSLVFLSSTVFTTSTPQSWILLHLNLLLLSQQIRKLLFLQILQYCNLRQVFQWHLHLDFLRCRTRHPGTPKNNPRLWKKNKFLASCSFRKKSCLRSRHLVLWSLGTLTGQQRFYGQRLVT